MFLNKDDKNTNYKYIEICKIIFLSLVFFAVIFIYDRVQRLSYLHQNNLTKYQQIEAAYQKEIIFIKDLSFEPNNLDLQTNQEEVFIKLKEKQKNTLEEYKKFISTKDLDTRKQIIHKAHQNSLEFLEYKNQFYKENSDLDKQISEYKNQLTDYNNYINTFPNYLIARILDYAPTETIF